MGSPPVLRHHPSGPSWEAMGVARLPSLASRISKRLTEFVVSMGVMRKSSMMGGLAEPAPGDAALRAGDRVAAPPGNPDVQLVGTPLDLPGPGP